MCSCTSSVWSGTKSICNKFCSPSPSPRSPGYSEHNEVVFATTEGKVKVERLKTNKAATLYAHPDGAYCVALVQPVRRRYAAGIDGRCGPSISPTA